MQYIILCRADLNEVQIFFLFTKIYTLYRNDSLTKKKEKFYDMQITQELVSICTYKLSLLAHDRLRERGMIKGKC